MAFEPQPSREPRVTITRDPIDPSAMLDAVRRADCGAVVLFLGTVRDHAPGRTGVTHLEYEVYEEHVVPKIDEIVAEAERRWPVRSVAVAHRAGDLAVGEISVAVAAASPHRADAFDAGRYLIDELKRRAPIWKKEHWSGGAEWVREDRHHQAEA